MVEPETRPSLLLRLLDPLDQQAWAEFVSIYEPLLIRLLRRRGLQEADSRDILQQVVLAVSRDVEHWRPDGRQASFRRWLFKIARNQTLKFLHRGRPFERGVGGSDMIKFLRDQPEPDHRTITAFNDEYRNQLFHRAAEQARGEFSESNWQAFWRTCVLDEPVARVAQDLEMTTGAIYVARSRILAKFRKCVEKFEVDHD